MDTSPRRLRWFSPMPVVVMCLFIGFLTTNLFSGPNEEAEVNYDNSTGEFTLTYDGDVILSSVVQVQKGDGEIILVNTGGFTVSYNTSTSNGSNSSISQSFEFSLSGASDGSIYLAGSMQGNDAFPCAPDNYSGLPSVVRITSGFSQSALNTGIYSRRNDWALRFESNQGVTLRHKSSSGELHTFDFVENTRSIALEFKPNFFKRHKGMSYFTPEDNDLPSVVIAGWNSWKAYGATVTEDNITFITDWCYENLTRFGLEYIIVDDGWYYGNPGRYTRSVFAGSDWTRSNSQFSNGVKWLADYVHGKEMKLGLWFSPFGSSDDPNDHPDWWIRTSAGGAFLESGWHGKYFCDATVEEAVTNWLTKGVTAQFENGCDYFKLDGNMHVAYDAYENTGNYFPSKGWTWQNAMREGWKKLREAGPGKYFMACWSRIPEIAGIPDAMRIGEDKDGGWEHVLESATDLSKWFYEHGILWHADPDHMVLAKSSVTESRSWVTIQALTGTHMTFADPALDNNRMELVRRILPIITPQTRPLNLFGISNAPALWTLEINRPFGNWLVVANTDFNSTKISTLNFRDLGLDPEAEYTVYDYWNREYKGIHTGSYNSGRPGQYDVKVFSITEVREYPWIISTNRHISQGGVDLTEVQWDGAQLILSGKSLVVDGDPYMIVLHVPDAYTLQEATFGTTNATRGTDGDAATIRFTPSSTGEVAWSATFDGPTGSGERIPRKPTLQDAAISVFGKNVTLQQTMPNDQIYSIVVYDAFGRVLKTMQGQGTYCHTIPKQQFGPGLWVVRIKAGTRIFMHKILLAL